MSALGLATLGTVGTAVYRAGTAGSLAADLRHDATAPASDTLAGATAVADGLTQVLARTCSSPRARPSRKRWGSRPR